MKFHIVTNVWGTRHVAFFLDVTLRNVLSPGNLPAMGAYGDVTYRIFTTVSGERQIRDSRYFAALTEVCDVEFVTPLGDRMPDVVWHVHWFHRSAAEAKLAGACPVFVPPDTLWTDGSLRTFAARLAEGYKGVACPFLLVNSDTLTPSLQAFEDGAALTIDAAEIARLGLQHLHPLHMLAMPGAPHARPAFEMHRSVDAHTMVSNYAVRELVAFDPSRCPITFLWYAGGDADPDGIYFGDDSDDMLMLSVDPIGKYPQNYILNHSLGAIDLARTSIHPLNDTAQTRSFIRKPVRIHSAPASAPKLRRTEAKAKTAAIEMEAGRRALQLVREMNQAGARRMAQLLSVAIFETPILRRWRRDEPLDAIALSDGCFRGDLRVYADSLVRQGNEPELMSFLQGLVVGQKQPGRLQVGARSVDISWRDDGSLSVAGQVPAHGPIHIEGTRLWILDQI